ncbi:sirohydrochlorin chelatase [Alteribacillus sp. HJP-4]|uniref:sirohydrochlorin chelatase n=1 Tax=Alteribacillus sp. HJP-4 TaxID=2775394 RepID=UPI0035CCDCA0
MQAILYVGHGSRVKKGNEQLQYFVDQVKKRMPHTIQETCFLELAEPDIIKGADTCVQQGANSLVVSPVLLLAAGHIKKDIPDELARVQQKYPELPIHYGDPFGLHEKVLDVLEQRLASQGWDASQKADILLVGRGSSDEDALADFDKMREALRRKTGAEHVQKAFLAAAAPSFDEGLERMTTSRAEVVYVLPYLLFTGILMKEMEDAIKKKNNHSSAPIKLCDFLGYDEQLCEVLKQKTQEAANAPLLFPGAEPNV